MTLFFLRLSKVRIFPNAAVQAKKATFNGALVRQILFQGNKDRNIIKSPKRNSGTQEVYKRNT